MMQRFFYFFLLLVWIDLHIELLREIWDIDHTCLWIDLCLIDTHSPKENIHNDIYSKHNSHPNQSVHNVSPSCLTIFWITSSFDVFEYTVEEIEHRENKDQCQNRIDQELIQTLHEIKHCEVFCERNKGKEKHRRY